MNRKKIVSTIALLGMFLLPGGAFATGGYTPDFAGESYTTDLTSCYTSYNTGIYECAVNSYVLTAWTGSDAMSPCATVASAPTWQTTGTSSTTSSTSNSNATGGWYFNCLGSDASTYDNWECRPDSDNIANHIATTCTGLATSTYASVTQGSNTNCLSGYTNCDTDLTDCEINVGVTSYPGAASAVYNASCSAVCDATHLSCDGTSTDPANDADGCEITENVTAASQPNTVYGTSCAARVCDATHFLLQGDSITTEGCLGVLSEECTVTANSLPGTCTGAGTTGTLTSNGAETCACSELDIPEFATGGYVDADGVYTQSAAEFETSDPLLWGKQTGTGGFIDFSDAGGTKFAVDKTGKITSGFIGQADLTGGVSNANKILGINASGEPVWTTTGDLSGSGDNLGDHTATETLKMGSNKIVSGLSDTKGIAIATSTGKVTMYGDLTVSGTGLSSVGGAFTTGGNLTVNGTGASSVGGAFTAGGNLTINGTGTSVIAGDLTVSDGDLILGDTNSAGTIQLSDGSSNTMTLQTGAMAGNLSMTLPTAAPAVDGLVLTTNTSGVTSWTYKTGDDLTCANGEVMRWNTTGSVWECANPGVITAQTLEDAYDTGTNAATRTIAVDADAIKFNGSHATNDVFQLAQASGGTGDVIDIVNEGTGNAVRINDGTTDTFVVDANGNLTITSDTGTPLTINTDEFVVDTDGNTILKQLRLVAAVADANGKPTATCAASFVGNIAYVVLNNQGYYYGCKQTGESAYSWVSLEVFGA